MSGGRLRPRERIELPEYPVDAAWSPDGRTLAVGLADGALMLVSVADPASSAQAPPPVPTQRLEAHDGAVLAVAWQKSGRSFASSGQDGAVLLWDARARNSRAVLQDAQWSERLAFADNGKWLAVATGRTLSLIDDQGELRHRYAAQPGAIAALAWRPKSGEIASAGNGGVRIHRPPPQLESRELSIRGACLSAAFNPDGRLLAAGLQEGAVLLWNLATGSQSQMAGYGSRVFATDWSANGRYLATAAGSTLAVWDFSGKGPEGSRPLTYQAHSERITAIAFRPSGTWLVSAALDRRLLLWRVGTGDTPQDAHLLAEECSLLRFSRDGARLAVGDAGAGLAIFDCAP
ncbi:MAG: WD40 repeat domain-containing protein [Steroidobacteraceae bacterium]